MNKIILGFFIVSFFTLTHAMENKNLSASQEFGEIQKLSDEALTYRQRAHELLNKGKEISQLGKQAVNEYPSRRSILSMQDLQQEYQKKAARKFQQQLPSNNNGEGVSAGEFLRNSILSTCNTNHSPYRPVADLVPFLQPLSFTPAQSAQELIGCETKYIPTTSMIEEVQNNLQKSSKQSPTSFLSKKNLIIGSLIGVALWYYIELELQIKNMPQEEQQDYKGRTKIMWAAAKAMAQRPQQVARMLVQKLSH